MALTPDEVLAQSEAAFRQWDETWSKHSKINGEMYKAEGHSHKELLWEGAGKTMLCCALGPSFEDNIGLIKEHKDNPALLISCVDKCMGPLIDNDIIPDYVIIADAGIDYNKWCAPWIDKTDDITLIANVNANPEWTTNWKGRKIFYVNKDNIQTEKKYSEISGCHEFIPASSNVGNTVVVFTTQILGCDEYILLGYDYCWGDEDNYYAFGDSNKRWWMRHAQMVDLIGRLVNTSQNLIFSARWLTDYWRGVLIQQNIKIVNCSGKGILELPKARLETKLRAVKKRPLTQADKNKIAAARMESIRITALDGKEKLENAIKDHNVTEVIVNHIPQEVREWLQ